MKHPYQIKKIYSILNIEEITNADYRYSKRVWESFGKKYIGAYHDLYVPGDKLLLADIFRNLQNK